jgi:hypothetical protein
MIDGNDFLEKISIGDGESAWLDIGDDEDIFLPGSPEAHGCQLFFAGHCPHWIQNKQSVAEPDRTGRLVAVEGRVIAIDFFSEVKCFANHDVDRLGAPSGDRTCTSRLTFGAVGYLAGNKLRVGHMYRLRLPALIDIRNLCLGE